MCETTTQKYIGGGVRGIQIVFAEKDSFLVCAQESTKSILYLSLLLAILFAITLQPLNNQRSEIRVLE
jgi:hypothetical protein